jgi:CRP-like cAMP-binding protein
MTQYFKELFEDSTFSEQVSCKVERFEPQDIIIKEGEKSRNVYMVVDGAVHVSTDIILDKDNRRNVGIAKLSKNEIFGELSMFDDMPHNASVVAASRCEIAVIDSQELNRFLNEHPKYGYHVMRDIVNLLVKRMRQNNIRSSSILGWYLRESDEDSED